MIWVLALLLWLDVPDPLQTAQQKSARIESGHLPAGTVMIFSGAELTALAKRHAAEFGKGSIRNTQVNLWLGHAGIIARVDLAHLAQARGNPMQPLLARMLAGERQIRAVLRLETAHGRALVALERLEVDGSVLEGRPLDLLIQQFVSAEFPDAHLNQWFVMEYRIDAIVLSKGQATVTVRGQPSKR